MKGLVPRLLSSLVRRVKDSLSDRKVSRLRIVPPRGEVALSYAGMIPPPGTPAHGGRVKLAHLGARYPEREREFNILYLVSSALPPSAREYVEVSRRSGVRIVWNQNGVGYRAWAGDNTEAVNAPLREMIHRSDWVVYQSEFCRTAADAFLGRFEGPSSVVYNCVDTGAFTPTEAPPPPSPVRLLVMGSHNQAYRVLAPLEALALLLKTGVEARLVIAGRLAWPGADEEVRKRIAGLGLEGHVELRGPYLQEDAPGLYRAAHVLVHPKYNDACPTVPIEAMACGVPVIGSASGGVPELLDRSGGIAIPAPADWDQIHVASPEEIAGAVRRTMGDWASWSAGCRRRAVEKFSSEGWLEAHRAIFERLVPRGP